MSFYFPPAHSGFFFLTLRTARVNARPPEMRSLSAFASIGVHLRFLFPILTIISAFLVTARLLQALHEHNRHSAPADNPQIFLIPAFFLNLLSFPARLNGIPVHESTA